jgi:hypothetical protein
MPALGRKNNKKHLESSQGGLMRAKSMRSSCGFSQSNRTLRVKQSMIFQIQNKKWLNTFLMVLAFFSVSACTQTTQKVTGSVLSGVANDLVLPDILAGDDIVAACDMATALKPFFTSFEPLNVSDGRLVVTLELVNGQCAFRAAKGYSLKADQAFFLGQATIAKDYQTQAKRLYQLSAKRFYSAHNAFLTYYDVASTFRSSEFPKDTCPSLSTEVDELAWVFGSLAGVQALLADAQAGQSVGVPRGIAGQTDRALVCVYDDTASNATAQNLKWWGLPLAMKSAIRLMIPGIEPVWNDPWGKMDEALRVADQSGVRLAYAFSAIVASNVGNQDKTIAVIKKHHNTESQGFKLNQQYAMADSMGTDLLMLISDEFWMQEKGYRTPFLKYGEFPNDKKEAVILLDDDLLEGF